jgi:hypothetical protein
VVHKRLSVELEKNLLQLSGFEPGIFQTVTGTIPTTLARKAPTSQISVKCWYIVHQPE